MSKTVKGVTGNLYGMVVLPNTIKELVQSIYDQTGDDAISREDALDMAEWLEQSIKNGTYGGVVPRSFMFPTQEGE